jgi:hypothetical protein
MYFEGPAFRSGTNLPQRTIEYADGRSDLSRYDSQSLPVQWAAWLRHTRPHPPTLEEIHSDELKRLEIIQRAKILDEKWALDRSVKSKIGDGVSGAGAGAGAGARVIEGESKGSSVKEGPVGQGETFSPGAWDPSSSSAIKRK